MKTKNTTPPNWLDIIKRFPAIEQMVDRVIFTYYPEVYVPSGAKLPSDIQLHEGIHLRQQHEYGVASWWKRYLADDDFRLEQELEAYAAQLHMWRPAGNSQFQKAKDRMVNDLISPAYDLKITYSEAEGKLRRYEKLLN